MCKVRSKLTLKTLERRHWCRSSVCIVNFDQVNVSWVYEKSRTKQIII